ncbi:MAG: hypothetical protein IJK39_08950 [Bacteroidales bacterium]|nr:hypothetical protein [Bacteroidales bacterium]MBR6972416.1 hypothetical protein [Bacteroidales bacterium]
MTTGKKTLKVLVTTNQQSKFNGYDIVLNKTNYNYDDLEDCVLLSNKGYSELIQKKDKRRKMLPIIKITFDKHSIYRRYKHISLDNLKCDDVCLTFSSINQLSDKRVEETVGDNKVSISKGCWIPYYWYHPFHATRAAFRIGLPALILSFASLIISIFC